MKPTQLLKEQSNAEKINNESAGELIKYDKIENTPFTMVTENKMYYLTMGQYRLSEKFERESDLIEWMYKNSWNLMLSIAMIVHENMENYKNQTI